jgi:hypothetical protein
MEQKRGQLTQRIKDKSKELLGYEITVRELRFMPFIIHTMMNSQKIDIQLINGEEREILKKWKEQGHIVGGASFLGITEQFWNICCEIVRLGYVDLTD